MKRPCSCNSNQCRLCHLHRHAPQYFCLFNNLPVPPIPDSVRTIVPKEIFSIWEDPRLVKKLAETYGIDLEELVDKPLNAPSIQSSPVPVSEWPYYAQFVAKMKSSEDKGIGDTIARNLSYFGADALKKLYTKITGKDCGCPDRQVALNQLYPYQ